MPEGLKTMLGAIKSEILDPKNRNKVERNIPKVLLEALTELVNLQKRKEIIIKRCDKGAGIIILDYEEYVRASIVNLNSKQENKNGTTSPYYTKVEEKEIKQVELELKQFLEEAHDNDIITDSEYKHMNPEGKNVAKFYMNFKVHKDHEEGKAPPERPICSGSGSTLENVSKFIEHHIKDHATKHPTFLQDTPDFLQQIEEINKKGLSPNTVLFTLDVIGLFTNIPNKEGIEATRDVLLEINEKEIGTEFLVRLLKFILENNIIEFGEEYFRQNIGAPMGSRPVPHYANNFMAKYIDPKLIELAKQYSKDGTCPITFLKRFWMTYFLFGQEKLRTCTNS